MQVQVVFFLTDGALDQGNRARIQHWVREATERRQLVVLVVLDSLLESNSILRRTSVQFVGGKPVTRCGWRLAGSVTGSGGGVCGACVVR